MKHVTNFAGIALVAYLLSLAATLGETRVLYDQVSGFADVSLRVEDWLKQFADWATYGIIAGALGACLWYIVAELMLSIDFTGNSTRRPVWVLLGLLPAVVSELGVFMLPSVQSGAWLARAFLFVNSILCYWLVTALFSPASFKYTPVLSTALRPLRDKLPV